MEIKPIVLCSLNSKYIHSSPAVYYIRDAFLRQFPEYKDSVAVLSATINDAVDHILYMITERRPAVVGFSVYIWNIAIVSKLCKALRLIDPDIKIILGGPEV
ncbi:MAG: cobalamin-dependent protein, partial [Acutalibacteraceae bacterium]